MSLTNHTCTVCQVALLVGENWQLSFARKGYYLCQSCSKIRSANWRAVNKDYIKQRAQNRSKSRIRRERTHNGWEWSLSLVDHRTITMWPCFYCHGPLNRTGTGLDRIDSARGYSLDNVVPCCARCNRMKSDLLTVDEMLLLWAIRRGETVNPLDGEISAPDAMNWALRDGVVH